MTTTQQRKWQMMRVEAGLYLLPSNNEQWVFKLHKSVIYDYVWVGDRNVQQEQSVWECSVRNAKALRYMISSPRHTDDQILHGDEWSHICYVGTRREAIDEAMAWERGQEEEL